MTEELTPEKPTAFAERLNRLVDRLHDPTISGNPFEWSGSEERAERSREILEMVSRELRAYRHVSKATTVKKILTWGVAVPLVSMLVVFLSGAYASGAGGVGLGLLGLVIVASAITAIVIGRKPSVDLDLALALYAVPRGWSFSRVGGPETWEEYVERYEYFDRGDEDQSINLRIWGLMNGDEARAFQMFHFHYVDVEYVTRTYTDSQGNTSTRTERHEHPRDRYGMFVQVPESTTRFRITESRGKDGLDESLSFEYAAFNKAVNVYCDDRDELAIRQFLSPAVLEVALKLSDDLSDLVIDFYPGHVLLTTKHDFLDGLSGVKLDETTSTFEERLRPGLETLEGFRTYIDDRLNAIRKYND